MDVSNEPEGTVRERISARLGTLSRAEQRVAEYLRSHAEDAVFATAEQIGTAAGTSDATVVRTAQRLGYSGLIELKYDLGHEVLTAGRAAARLHSRIELTGGDSATLLGQVFTEAVERLTETWRALPVEDFDRAVALLGDARTVAAIGLGPSESVARYLALRLHRIGRPAWATGATGFRLADELIQLDAGDVVVLYLPSRLLPDIVVLLAHARRVGARTILVTDSLGPALRDRVELVLPSVRSHSGFSGQGLCAQTLTDALVLGVAALDLPRAADTGELLVDLRAGLTGPAQSTRDA